MTARTLLAELNRLGVELYDNGARLRYAGPKEVITEELLEKIRAQKAELLSILRLSNTDIQEPPTAEGAKGTEASSRQTDEGSDMLTHTCIVGLRGTEENELAAAGWAPKERLGQTIWQSPENGFWYSQEMAVHFLNRGIGNIGCKSGANGRR